VSELLEALLRAARGNVEDAEKNDAACRSVASARLLVATRTFLAAVELYAEQTRVKHG
jgi:hypothetical protein